PGAAHHQASASPFQTATARSIPRQTGFPSAHVAGDREVSPIGNPPAEPFYQALARRRRHSSAQHRFYSEPGFLPFRERPSFVLAPLFFFLVASIRRWT